MRPGALVAVLAAACGGGAGADEVVSLRVEPAEVELRVRAGEPAEQAFEAFATFGNGEEASFPLVGWSLTNLSVGEISPEGVLRTVDANGGVAEVVARHLDVEGRARVVVVYEEDVLGDGADEALAAAFDAAEQPEPGGAALLYPPDGVAFPRNLEGLAFAWSGPEGANAARLRIRSEITDVRVTVVGDRWEAPSELWQRAAAANTAGEVSVDVLVGTWDGSALTGLAASDPVDVRVFRMDARGSVYYWSTLREAIMRIPFGETESRLFWDSEDSGGRCTGCHALARDADRMAVVQDGINGHFTVLDVTDPDSPELALGSDEGRRSSFVALSPDGRFLVGTTAGVARLWDAESGDLLRDWSEDVDGYVVQPDFAPDGRAIAFVEVRGQVLSDFQFTGGEIVEYDFDPDTLDLDGPRVLVAQEADWNHYYPAYSPDGRFLAYNRAPGNGYAAEDAELWLLDLETGRRARLENAEGDGTRNSGPRWGPLPDADVLWLAFSSRRSLPWSEANQPQVWVSAVEPDAVDEGEDPSSPAFWLPGQDPASDNHLPAWGSR